jgi:hypothetical protein
MPISRLQRYYHPSNARLFFFGDDDPIERLRLLDSCLRSPKIALLL